MLVDLFLLYFAIFSLILLSCPTSSIPKKAMAQGDLMTCIQMIEHQLQPLINYYVVIVAIWALEWYNQVSAQTWSEMTRKTAKDPELWQLLGPRVWLEQDGGTVPGLGSRQLKEISASICQLITEYHSNIIQPEPALWLSSHYPTNIRWTSYNFSWHKPGCDEACFLKIVSLPQKCIRLIFVWCFDLKF